MQVSQAAVIRAKWRSDHVFLSYSDTSRRGVLTLIHPRNDPKHLHEVNDPHGQFHILVTCIRDEVYLLCNTYSDPCTDRNAEATMMRVMNGIDSMTLRFPIQHIIVAGDFNFVLRDEDTNSMSRKPRAAAVMNTIINSHDLYDIASLQSTTPSHTYFRHRNESCSARYDRFHVSLGILESSVYRILSRTSDHAPISMSTPVEKTQRSWKFSDALLSNPAFISGLHDCIRRTMLDHSGNTSVPLIELQNNIDYSLHPSPAIFASLVKNIRSYAVTETRKLSNHRRQEEQRLIRNIVEARNAVNMSHPPTESAIDDLETAQQALMMAQTRRVQAASEMNSTNYAGMGERVSRYHFLRSGKGKPSREIPKLLTHGPNGVMPLERSEIPMFMFEKYANIVQEDPIAGTLSIQEFLGYELTQTLRRCPDEDKQYLEAPVMSIEISNIIQELKSVSAPGPLGLTNNLLKEIVPLILNVLTDLGNRIFFDDEMPALDPFFFHRLVIFILKPGKVCTDPDAYRGLSLLEGFFKLYSKLLANRIQKPMRAIQNPQQFGFTKNKGCFEASRTVLDVIQHAKRNNLPLIVISTDFYKAFDSIAHCHIQSCFELFQFP